MNKRGSWLVSPLPILLLLLSCTGSGDVELDLINDSFPEAQAELREAVRTIADDAMTANIEGLQAIHLKSDKFTKFGPRTFDRQDLASTNESEAAFFSSVEDLTAEVKELKVDVFGDVAVVTYYPHVTFVRDGEEIKTSGRQTLVFLKTPGGWKIVHEHGTPKR
jgi:ketosteroid isomerase-like protein